MAYHSGQFTLPDPEVCLSPYAATRARHPHQSQIAGPFDGSTPERRAMSLGFSWTKFIILFAILGICIGGLVVIIQTHDAVRRDGAAP